MGGRRIIAWDNSMDIDIPKKSSEKKECLKLTWLSMRKLIDSQ